MHLSQPFLWLFIRKFIFPVLISLTVGCTNQEHTVQSVMDELIPRLYETMNEQELSALTTQDILQLLSEKDKQVLATKYWSFNINFPVVVSLMHHQGQKVLPFWIEESGFTKTSMIVNNEEYTYDVWQKSFNPGKVELGINGFDMHRPHYFLAVGLEDKNDQFKLERFFPENQFVSIMDTGSFTYHDWDELVLTDVPEKLVGHKLLTTIRGRAREAHVIKAFRKTPFVSSDKADQILLTWSDDPSTTQVIQWRTNLSVKGGLVRYWEKGSDSKKDYREIPSESKKIHDRLLQNDPVVLRHTVNLKNLKPATTYHYIVGDKITDNWSKQASFTTGPQSPAPFSFVYFGDTHRSPLWGKLINNAFKQKPQTAFYTIGGDVVSTGLYRDDWDQLFGYSADVIKYRPLMPALGNHDSQDGLGPGMFLDLFELPKNGPANLTPERAYSLKYSNALLLFLDATAIIDDQTEWLEKQLSQSNAVWKFAILHFPPYSYEEDYPEIREKWGALFDKYHVDMVLSGHVHYYMRSKPVFNQKPVSSTADGTIYIISIAIPNRQGEMDYRDYVDVRFDGEMLYQTFDINGNRLVYQACNENGIVHDHLVIDK